MPRSRHRVARWTHDTEENNPDPTTFYVGGPRGYTDYPERAAH